VARNVVNIEEVSKAFDIRPLLDGVSLGVSEGERIGIVGRNGSGKSTLMKIIAGIEDPDAGRVTKTNAARIGILSQIDTAQENATVGDVVIGNREKHEWASDPLIREIFTGLFGGFDDHLFERVFASLSGGEKRRLFLLRILISAPNVLILDEPTNDLDVQTLAVLEDYLEDFNGCVIVVSHDRYFLDRTVDRIFALEEGGGLRQYPGNYSIYLDYKKAEEAEKQETQKPVIVEEKVVSPVTETKKRRRLSNWERREFAELEGKIAKLEADKTALEKKLATVAGNYSEVQKLYEQVETLKKNIDLSTERWLELAEMDS